MTVWLLFISYFPVCLHKYYFSVDDKSKHVKKDINYEDLIHPVSLCVFVELNVWDVGQHRQYRRKEDGYDLYHWRHPTLVPVCFLRLTGKSTHWTLFFTWLTHSRQYIFFTWLTHVFHHMDWKTCTYMSCVNRVCHILSCACACHLSAVFFIWPSIIFIMQLDARHKNSIVLTAVICWFTELMSSMCDHNVCFWHWTFFLCHLPLFWSHNLYVYVWYCNMTD